MHICIATNVAFCKHVNSPILIRSVNSSDCEVYVHVYVTYFKYKPRNIGCNHVTTGNSTGIWENNCRYTHGLVNVEYTSANDVFIFFSIRICKRIISCNLSCNFILQAYSSTIKNICTLLLEQKTYRTWHIYINVTGNRSSKFYRNRKLKHDQYNIFRRTTYTKIYNAFCWGHVLPYSVI